MNNIKEFRESIDEKLISYLPEIRSRHHEQVVEAMKYSFTIGGKRIRPMLMYGAFLLVGGRSQDYACLEVLMTSMEMIHTYSLIHDDLPAMDNDDLRRGKATCHKVYGEANAILAGDGLLNYAYEIVVNEIVKIDDAKKSKNMIKSLSVLTKHAGIYGMIGGQAADIKFENQEMTNKSELDYIHHNKTGALIRAALMIGGIMGQANEKEVNLLKKIGDNIGLAFQVQDDLLDLLSTEEVLGKPIGSDKKNNKKTYLSFVGMDQSQKDIKALLKEAKELVLGFKGNSELLIELIEFLENRTY